MKLSNQQQPEVLAADIWPDIHSSSWATVSKLLKKIFNSGEKRNIFLCYPWVEHKDVKIFGEKIGNINLLDCNIQADVKEIQRFLESVGFGVSMDLANNNHGGEPLKDQITRKIETFDIVVCFLTPVFKLKVADYTDKSYVLKDEYNAINKRTKPTFRFIMVGDRESSVPTNFESFLCTPQSHKTKIDRLKFILKKLLVSPDLPLDEGDDLFEDIWKKLGSINQRETKPSEPSTYASVQTTLSSASKDNDAQQLPVTTAIQPNDAHPHPLPTVPNQQTPEPPNVNYFTGPNIGGIIAANRGNFTVHNYTVNNHTNGSGMK